MGGGGGGGDVPQKRKENARRAKLLCKPGTRVCGMNGLAPIKVAHAISDTVISLFQHHPFCGRREREMVAHGKEFISMALYVKGKLSELKVVLRVSLEGMGAFH